jgi:hypothetical protein
MPAVATTDRIASPSLKRRFEVGFTTYKRPDGLQPNGAREQRHRVEPLEVLAQIQWQRDGFKAFQDSALHAL